MTRQKGRKRSAPIRAGATPTKERRRQNGGVVAETIAQEGSGKALFNRYRAVWECPLDAYRDFRVITKLEHLAGIRFREAYHRAVLSRPAIRERLNNYPTSTRLTMSEKLLNDAYSTLPPYNKRVIIDICGHDLLAQDGKRLNALKKGLGHLALRWHMAAIEVCEH